MMSTSTPRSASAPSATLPELLADQVATRATAIAIRHKVHGTWVAWTWAALRAEVARVAAVLSARGFAPGDVVVVATGPTPPGLVVTLAAQGLGGAAAWIEPASAGSWSATPPTELAPPGARFALADDERALQALRARVGAAGPWALGLHLGAHGSMAEADASVRAYADAAADGREPEAEPPRLRPSDAAFVFLAAGDPTDRRPPVTHAALVAAARAWVDGEQVNAGLQAFACEGPTTEEGAVFIAGWLASGFALGLPEQVTTADADRRELQPALVAATGASYGTLWRRVVDNLPAPTTLPRALVDAGLAGRGGGASWLARLPGRLSGRWLVRRPLRRVLGFGRVEVALVLGASPPAAAAALFAQLGVPLRALQRATRPQVSAAPGAAPALVVDRPGLFDPALALAPSSSGEGA